MNAEQKRLAENNNRDEPWHFWGPYLADRAWGTVREDYSANGDAWNYFPHDHARSRGQGVVADNPDLLLPGSLDFAGGTAIHVNAGISALAAVLVLGKRKGWPREGHPPHNMPLAMIGTGILWFGWFGFNAGSALAANGQAVQAFVNTFVAAAAAGLAWRCSSASATGTSPTSALRQASWPDWWRSLRVPASSPACRTLFIGGIAGVVCCFAVGLKRRFGYDDALDVVGVHFVGGLVGSLLLGLFADASFFGGSEPFFMDGLFLGGGADLLIEQVIANGVTIVYAFVMTTVIMLALKATIGVRVERGGRGLGARRGGARRDRLPRRCFGHRDDGLRPGRTDDETCDCDHQAIPARRGEGRPQDRRRPRHDRQRGAGVRPPGRPHRGVPGRGVHRRLRAEAEGRGAGRRRRGRRDRRRPSPSRPAPGRSATARSGSPRSSWSSASAPASSAPTPSNVSPVIDAREELLRRLLPPRSPVLHHLQRPRRRLVCARLLQTAAGERCHPRGGAGRGRRLRPARAVPGQRHRRRAPARQPVGHRRGRRPASGTRSGTRA